MSASCEVPNCTAPARWTLEVGVEREVTELCTRHADRIEQCGGKARRRLAVAS